MTKVKVASEKAWNKAILKAEKEAKEKRAKQSKTKSREVK